MTGWANLSAGVGGWVFGFGEFEGFEGFLVSSFRFHVGWDEGARGFGVTRVQRFKDVKSSTLFKVQSCSRLFDVRYSKLFLG
jgi:hypothetical protein